jgi:N-acyl-D-aspartate/D-glutamate deacylase
MNLRVKRIDELAQDVPPPRDLWPAIAAAIEVEKASATGAQGARRHAGWWPVSAMAASVALVALGVWIGLQVGPTTQPPVAGVPRPVTDANRIPASLQRDEKYREQRDHLLVEVQNRLKSMPAAERDKVAASLATLRRSIGEIEAALGRDPANALLQELLVSSCQEEMRALTTVRDAGSQEI